MLIFLKLVLVPELAIVRLAKWAKKKKNNLVERLPRREGSIIEAKGRL